MPGRLFFFVAPFAVFSFAPTSSRRKLRRQQAVPLLRSSTPVTEPEQATHGRDEPRRRLANAQAGSLTIEELLRELQTTSSGLTSSEANRRLEEHGYNELTTPPKDSLWELVLEQFEDRLVQILLAVAVLSAIFSFADMEAGTAMWKSFVEPAFIFAILILNASVGVWQTQSASDSLQALQKLQPAVCTVIRDGDTLESPANVLVPGDVLQIRAGDKVPADCRLVSLTSSSLFCDEGSLTGESATVSKLPGNQGISEVGSPVQDQRGMLYASSMVTSGSGSAVVVRTGMNTEIGKIQETIVSADAPKTPLGIRLDEFSDKLTKIIGIICAAVWIFSIPKMDDPSFSSVFDGAIYYAKVAVALGVAAIPEGLPAVITLCLSLGTRKMAERNVIVRKLPSVETLGCTSVICTDKTGTLTTNEMTAVSLLLFGNGTVSEKTIEGFSYSPEGRVKGVSRQETNNLPLGSVADVAAVSSLCNDAKIVGSDKNDDEKKYTRVGEPTEAALCVLAEKLGANRDLTVEQPSLLASANVNQWRSNHPRLATLEFTRDRKSMSVLCNFSGDNGEGTHYRLLVKGAPNLLIERCTKIKLRDGTVSAMTDEMRDLVERRVSELAARPLRCLALAVKEDSDLDERLQQAEGDLSRHPLLSDPAFYRGVESGLTLVGIVGIKDPARPEVADSIAECTKAGIRVLMITGDALDTAVAIARDVSIFPKDEPNVKAYEGREFFLKSQQEQLEILKADNIIFCRAEPADKQRLVKLLQSLGEIPAMTGDGVNDAPALQQSAIGVAMGVTGTEVAKEAADMILADDNFSTIVNAVEEGRRIYANMQAFICFLISCNIGEICAIFFATIAGFPEPLTAMHLLWVNLVTDGPPATALGFNPPAPDLMDQPPRPSDEPIMTRWLLTRYCLTGLYVGIATIGVFAQHYLAQGITLQQLASWSQCTDFWSPASGAATCSDLFQESGRMLPQTLSLTTLITMEMIKALGSVSVNNSLLSVGPQKNPWLLLGVAVPFLLHLLVLYSSTLGLPVLGESFGVVPLSWDNWISVLCWSAPILLVDEILKTVGRQTSRHQRPGSASRKSQ